MKKGKFGIVSAICVSAVLCTALPAWTGEETDATKNTQNQEVQAPRLPTLYTVRDAATGKLRAMTTAEREAAGLPEILSRRSDDLPGKQAADGTVNHDLQGRFQSAVLIKRLPDGTVETTCVDTMEAANAFMARKSAGEVTYDR